VTDFGEIVYRRFSCNVVDSCEFCENLCSGYTLLWGLEEILHIFSTFM
jgi:hypothetical protein